MKAKLFLAICCLVFSINVISQNIYETKQGSVNIFYEYNDSAFTVNSKKLYAKINYDNTNIKMTLELKTFDLEQDSLGKILIPNFDDITVTVEGKTSLPNIDTKNHSPQNFIFNGVLKAEKFKKKISGNGSLTHISDKGFPSSCYISIQFSLKLSDFKIKASDYHLKDVINIEVIQSVLKKQ